MSGCNSGEWGPYPLLTPRSTYRDKLKNSCDLCFYLIFLFFILFTIMKSEID